VVGGREYLFDSVGDLCLVADVPRIKRCISVALNDVKDSYRVTAGKQSIYNVATDETAAADDEERVALWGGHGVYGTSSKCSTKWSDLFQSCIGPRSREHQ
jgi:hypothetical protein